MDLQADRKTVPNIFLINRLEGIYDVVVAYDGLRRAARGSKGGGECAEEKNVYARKEYRGTGGFPRKS